MTQFCIQGASTLKKSNEKRMATSFPESSVYQSKSFAKLLSRKLSFHNNLHNPVLFWALTLAAIQTLRLVQDHVSRRFFRPREFLSLCFFVSLHVCFYFYFNVCGVQLIMTALFFFPFCLSFLSWWLCTCEWTTLVYFYFVHVFLSFFFSLTFIVLSQNTWFIDHIKVHK